ncbi:hypothetical protein G9C98_006204, partial [Cotesia typhae]
VNILVALVLILPACSEYKSSDGIKECPPNQIKCNNNNKCIDSTFLCDGTIDCPDASDEFYCTCKDRISVEYRCDGIYDCPNGEDEMECFGCNNNSFSCFEETDDYSEQQCVTLSQRCDGIWQCENGRDEQDCHLLKESYMYNDDIVSVGYSSGYLFKNWYGKWYPVCSSTWTKAVKVWAHSACSSEVGLLTSHPTINIVPVRRGLGLFISQTKTGKIQLQQDCGGQAIFVKCPEILCGLIAPKAPTFEIFATSRISGGKKSKPHAWPFNVAIYTYYFLFIGCSGTIIDEEWILTAAHCAESHPGNYYRIYAGIFRHLTWSPMTQTRRVEFVIRHPNFNFLTGANDIALMKLDEPLKFNRYVRKLCLPLPTWRTIPAANEICTVIGWGISTQNGGYAKELQEVELQIFGKCNDSHICTYSKGKDACQGDSGGPLMCRIPDSNRLYVAGIVNREQDHNPCGDFNAVGVYARVSFNYPWITRTINLDSRSLGYKLLEHCPGYQCYGENGICYKSNTLCDGIIHCWTGIDEFKNCSKNLTVKFVNRDNKYSIIKWNSKENVDYFICTNVTQTIPRSLRCDKKIDCQDGSDELNCRCTDILYIKHPLSICNGRIDCADKSDELNCHDGRNKNNTYLCARSAVIIPVEKRCNGIRDCQLSDDEIDCYALTNGSHIELDLEGSTVLKTNGIVSVNRNNTWTIKCFRNTTKWEDEANKYCNILGFGNHNSFSPHYIDGRILKVYTSSKNSSITFNRDEVIKYISQRSRRFGGCFALFVECQMNFKSSLGEYLYESNWTNEETYLLPWESTIFIDGKYHCPALLLDTTWALISTRCTKNINFEKNITAVVAGLSIPYQHVNGPHEEIRMVDHIENVGKLHTALLHFNKLPITRYIKPIFLNHTRPYSVERDYCQATGVNQKLEKKSTQLVVNLVDCPKNRQICFKNSIENWCS